MSEKNTKFDTRLDQRNHKRKKNNILNILIGIVILLIIVVTVNIVTGDDEKESADDKSTSTLSLEEETENESIEQDENVESNEESDTITDSTESSSSNEETNTETDQEENASTDADENEVGNVTTEPSDNTNVESVVTDSSWQPIGTKQSGDHVSSYDSKSVDWDEKVKALAYAANLDTSNMYVKFIGNGGSPQKSIGTVTSKDGSEIYRISLEWIDGEGWKPTKKEKLKTLE